MKENKRRWLASFGAPSLLAVAIAAVSSPVTAEDALLEEVITIGTRVEGRSATDSSAPIDIVTGDEFVNQGDGDLNNLLRNVVPSYNVNAKPISDAASIVRPANLRGLPPDSTLVLVNGKRRHRASVISFLAVVYLMVLKGQIFLQFQLSPLNRWRFYATAQPRNTDRMP